MTSVVAWFRIRCTPGPGIETNNTYEPTLKGNFMFTRNVLILCCLFVACSVFYPATAKETSVDNWTMFHHDDRNTGFSTSAMPPANSLSLLWSYTVPAGSIGGDTAIHSSAAVVNNRVYFTSRARRLYCLNATSGSVLWTRSLGTSWDVTVPPLDNGTWLDSSPAVAAGKVFVGARDGKMYAFNAYTGTPAWVTDLTFPIMSSPMYFDSKIFVGTWEGIFYCLDAATGSIKACTGVDAGILNSPAVAVPGTTPPTTHYVIGEDGMSDGDLYWFRLNATETAFVQVRAYNTECAVRSSFCSCDGWGYYGDGSSYGGGDVTGLLKFSYPWHFNPTWDYPDSTQAVGHEWTCSTPAVCGDMVFLGGGYDSPEIFCVRDDGSTWTEMWTYDLTNAYHPLGVHSSPAVADGLVFIGLVQGDSSAQSSWLYCFDTDDGDELWKYDLGAGRVLSSPAIYNGKVYIGSPGGVFYCFGNDDG